MAKFHAYVGSRSEKHLRTVDAMNAICSQIGFVDACQQTRIDLVRRVRDLRQVLGQS